MKEILSRFPFHLFPWDSKLIAGCNCCLFPTYLGDTRVGTGKIPAFLVIFRSQSEETVLFLIPLKIDYVAIRFE